MRVLGIETSCDETGVAIYDSEKGLLGHVLHSQIELHQPYGGVVPELASRNHIELTLPLIKQILQECQLTSHDIDGIAYTAGPGLVGALLVGATIGRCLGWAWQIPTVAVHHLEGHLLAPLLEKNIQLIFPFIALLVSGGHTMLIEVKAIGDYQILGETIDDAAGEAFDKTAKLLGLNYPGGAELAKLALSGNPKQFYFPRPMMDRPGLDFSFSGLKTHAVTTLQKTTMDDQARADIAAGFEAAVVDTLVGKCKRALKQTGLNRLLIAGGVSANLTLRKKLTDLMKEFSGELYEATPEFCTDNGAMIALAGYHRLKAGKHDDLDIRVKPRWDLTEV